MSLNCPSGKGNNVAHRKGPWRQTWAARNGNECRTQTGKTRSNLNSLPFSACVFPPVFVGFSGSWVLKPKSLPDHLMDWISCCRCWRTRSHGFCVTLTFPTNTAIVQEWHSSECVRFMQLPSSGLPYKWASGQPSPRVLGIFSLPLTVACHHKYVWRWDHLRGQGQGWLCAALTD